MDSTGTWGFAEKLKSVEDMEYLFSLACLKKRILNPLGNALKEAQKGSAAPNPELCDLKTRQVVSLLSRAKPGRPLWSTSVPAPDPRSWPSLVNLAR